MDFFSSAFMSPKDFGGHILMSLSWLFLTSLGIIQQIHSHQGYKFLWLLNYDRIVRGGGRLIWKGSSLTLFLKKALKYEVEYWN